MTNKEIKAINEKDFLVEEISGCNEELVKQLVCLEEKCSPLEMRNVNSFEYFSKILKNPTHIALALKHKEKIIGFLLAREYKKIYKDLVNHDPDLEKCKNKYFYIEVVQIHPRYKNNEGLRLLVFRLFSRAMKNRIKGFCMHVRTKNGLNSLVKKYFNGKKLRSIDNWLGFKEKFDYMEVLVDKHVFRKQAA